MAITLHEKKRKRKQSGNRMSSEEIQFEKMHIRSGPIKVNYVKTG